MDGEDDHHERRALPLLSEIFPPSVTEPIRLHVEAKRYLCIIEPGYYEALSEASKASLAVQGGPMTPFEADQFLLLPYAREAIQLRRYDELAKETALHAPDAAHFRPHLEAALWPAGVKV